MDIDTRQVPEKMISNYVSCLFVDLITFMDAAKLTGKLNKGCWTNETGMVVGWIGYVPHNSQQEEEIELVLTLSGEIKDRRKNFDIGVYWSDGTVIQEIVEFDDIDSDDAAPRIDSIITQYKLELLSAMKEQMTIDRPPHYRENYS